MGKSFPPWNTTRCTKLTGLAESVGKEDLLTQSPPPQAAHGGRWGHVLKAQGLEHHSRGLRPCNREGARGGWQTNRLFVHYSMILCGIRCNLSSVFWPGVWPTIESQPQRTTYGQHIPAGNACLLPCLIVQQHICLLCLSDANSGENNHNNDNNNVCNSYDACLCYADSVDIGRLLRWAFSLSQS